MLLCTLFHIPIVWQQDLQTCSYMGLLVVPHQHVIMFHFIYGETRVMLDETVPYSSECIKQSLFCFFKSFSFFSFFSIQKFCFSSVFVFRLGCFYSLEEMAVIVYCIWLIYLFNYSHVLMTHSLSNNRSIQVEHWMFC